MTTRCQQTLNRELLIIPNHLKLTVLYFSWTLQSSHTFHTQTDRYIHAQTYTYAHINIPHMPHTHTHTRTHITYISFKGRPIYPRTYKHTCTHKHTHILNTHTRTTHICNLVFNHDDNVFETKVPAFDYSPKPNDMYLDLIHTHAMCPFHKLKSFSIKYIA